MEGGHTVGVLEPAKSAAVGANQVYIYTYIYMFAAGGGAIEGGHTVFVLETTKSAAEASQVCTTALRICIFIHIYIFTYVYIGLTDAKTKPMSPLRSFGVVATGDGDSWAGRPTSTLARPSPCCRWPR